MRNSRSLLLFVFLNACFLSNGQSTRKITSVYDRIEKELHEYNSKTVPVFYMSTEGGEVTGYYKNNTLQKLSAVLLGETGKWFQDGYYYKGGLIYVVETKHRYNAPIYFDQKLADEMGVTDVFDIEKTTITENRYYLKNDVVFKWLTNNESPEDVSTVSLKKKTEALLEDSKKLQELIIDYKEEENK